MLIKSAGCITIAEAGALIGVSRAVAFRAAQAGFLPLIVDAKGRRMVRKAALARLPAGSALWQGVPRGAKYHGQPCKRGHTERWVKTGHCVACEASKQRALKARKAVRASCTEVRP